MGKEVTAWIAPETRFGVKGAAMFLQEGEPRWNEEDKMWMGDGYVVTLGNWAIRTLGLLFIDKPVKVKIITEE